LVSCRRRVRAWQDARIEHFELVRRSAVLERFRQLVEILDVGIVGHPLRLSLEGSSPRARLVGIL